MKIDYYTKLGKKIYYVELDSLIEINKLRIKKLFNSAKKYNKEDKYEDMQRNYLLSRANELQLLNRNLLKELEDNK